MQDDTTRNGEASPEEPEETAATTDARSAPSPASAETVDSVAGDLAPGVPRKVGQYRIKRVIASGGMGSVYEALQERPRRTVAVKFIRAGVASPSALRRFEFEAQLLARLRHPGIAQIYEAGTHQDGDVTIPYFAMEYIVGAKPITDYAREKKLGTRKRIELFIKVCQAVHHGHQKGIIHRDLKPSNILVDSSGQVKIIDFGVARSTDSDMAVTTLQTDVGALLGTVQYMSPEQCAADPHDIDTRSDVYTLGVILYETLTGQPPYEIRGAALHEATRIIREQPPTRPSTVDRALRGDLETIALMALEKDRDRRYQSASALTADLERYLNSEAISARPPSVSYQIKVFARRNKGLFAAAATILGVLVAGIVTSTTLYFRAEAARADAATRAAELEQVAAFQERQLSEIDVSLMGARLRHGLLDKARTAAQRSGSEADARVAELGELLAGTDFTGLALELLDENIFERTVQAIDEQFADQPLMRARLLQTLATTVRDLGLLKQAEGPQQTALDLRRELLGEAHPETARSMHMMGVLRTYQGNLEEAERYIRAAVDGYRRELSPDDPTTYDAIGDIGVVLGRKREHEEALRYYREALDGCRRLAGDNDRKTLLAKHNLAVALRNLGQLDEAEDLQRQSLDGFRRIHGDAHPETLTSVHNLGHLLENQGRVEEAEDYFRESLDGRRSVLGDDHDSTIYAVNCWGQFLVRTGRADEAEPYFRRKLDADRQKFGEEHPQTLTAVNNMAFLLNRLGRHEEAARILRGSVRAARRVWAENEPGSLGNFLAKLGEAQVGMTSYVEAERTLLEAQELLAAGFGAEHPRTVANAQRLIAFYDARHAIEPGSGHDVKAAEWRAKLPGDGPKNGT